MALRLEALEKVREAERQVRELKAKAAEDKERHIRKAKGETLTLGEELRQEADDRYQSLLEAAAKTTGEERNVILEKGDAEAEKLRATAANRIDGAVELLLRRFEEAVRAEA